VGLERDEPQDAGDGGPLLVQTDGGVVPLHLLGHVAGQRPSNHRIDVRPTYEVGFAMKRP
jgi:hypothetical protein